MAITPEDKQRIGELIAKQLDEIDQGFGDSDTILIDAAVAVELRTDEGEDYRFSRRYHALPESSPFNTVGLLRWVADDLDGLHSFTVDEEDTEG